MDIRIDIRWCQALETLLLCSPLIVFPLSVCCLGIFLHFNYCLGPPLGKVGWLIPLNHWEMVLLVGLDRLLLISRMSGLNGGWWREVDRKDGRKVGETDIIPVSSFPPWGRFPQDCPCGCKPISVYTRGSVCFWRQARACAHTHTHCGLHFLTLSEPHKPQAMSETCHALCLLQSHVYTGRAKPAWHTKGGERCYLVSKLSLCLTYISAPKPPHLSITEKKSLLPRERVLETP